MKSPHRRMHSELVQEVFRLEQIIRDADHDARRIAQLAGVAAWDDETLEPRVVLDAVNKLRDQLKRMYAQPTAMAESHPQSVTAHLPGSAVTPAGRPSGSLLPSEDAQPIPFKPTNGPASRRAA